MQPVGRGRLQKGAHKEATVLAATIVALGAFGGCKVVFVRNDVDKREHLFKHLMEGKLNMNKTICLDSGTLSAEIYKNYSSANSGENPTVNLALGRLSYSFDDLSTGYGSYKIDVEHVYNSTSNSLFADKVVGMGTGWKLNIHQALVQQNSDTVLFLDADGEVHTFVRYDGNKFCDCQNAKTVLYYTEDSKYVTDGVGNKLFFNANGMLQKVVSCFNDQIAKILTYDDQNRIVQVHDARCVAGSTISNKVVFTYSGGYLQSAIAYYNSVKQFEVSYGYQNGQLVSVTNVGDGESLQELSFAYTSSKLSSVRNLQGNAFAFTYAADGKISKFSRGVLQNAFVEKAFNAYTYTCNGAVSYKTQVTNKNGIVVVYYLDTNGQIVSQFEKDGSNLKTLQKQGQKKTNFAGTESTSINGAANKSTGSSWSVSIPADFNVARNESEQNLQTFEYSFWLKHSCDCERMKASFNYAANGRNYYDSIYVNGRAKNAWQKVSLPLSFELDDEDKPLLNLSSLSISLSASTTVGNVLVNEIGFAPAPVSKFQIVSSGTIHDFDDIDRVFVDGVAFATTNNGTTGTYVTENDLLATLTNYYVKANSANQTVDSFDVIYCNGTKRKSAQSMQVGRNGVWLVTLPTTLRTKTETGTPHSVIYGSFSFENDVMTVTTTGQISGNGQTVSSSTVDRTHFNGNKHSYTDEYGVTTNYYYDGDGNITLSQVKDSSNVIVASKSYYYDTKNRPTATDNGTTGTSIGYNNKDAFAWQTETVKGESGFASTGHSTENTYGAYTDRVQTVKEKIGDTTVAKNTVTYQNGVVRTVSDGAVKYGIIDDIAGDKVTYTVFDGTSDTATERAVQEDSVSDYLENDDEIVVQTQTRRIFNSEGAEVARTDTDVDIYGRVQTTYQSGATGGKTQYTYTNGVESAFAGRLHQKFAPDGNYTEYCYDDDGNLTGWAERKSSQNGGGTTFEVKQVAEDKTRYTFGDKRFYVKKDFDSTKTQSPRLASVTHYGDPAETEASLKYKTAYAYDNMGNVVKASDSGINHCTYTHENIGGDYYVKEIHDVYGQNDSYGYVGTTTATRNQHGEIKKLVNSWTYGSHSETPIASGSSTRTFSYDAAHRLTQETNSALGLTKTYNYKPDGRIDKIVDSAKGDLQFHYDNRGRLHSVNTITAAYTYDLFGNRTQKVALDKACNYAYNASGQLQNVGIGTSNATYKYNADGVRCKKIVDDVTTEYYLDGDKILGEKHVSEDYSLYFIYDAFGINSIEYNGTSYKLIKDHQDNVIAMLNAAGDLIARYEYDAFGNCKVFNKYGTEITNSLGVAGINPFRWKSFYFDTETGLYYANGSYYDPEVGQYVDAAPIETVGDNAFCAGKLDRSAPVCDNILELDGNPHTADTTQELSADGTYNILDDLTPVGKFDYRIRQGFANFAKFFNKMPLILRITLGVVFFILAILATHFSGGALAPLFIELALGVGVAVAGYLISSLSNGEFSWEELGNTAANAFLLTSATLFIVSGISAIKYFYRQQPRLPSYELDPRSIELAKEGNPSWETFRKRVWQNEVKFNKSAYSWRNRRRMRLEKAPIKKGRSMHLHHVHGKANDLYDVIKVTAKQHTAIHKAIGYHVTKPKLPWTKINAIIAGGL